MELLAFGKEYEIQKLGEIIVSHINEDCPERFKNIIDYLTSNHDTEVVRRTLLFLDILRLLDSVASADPSTCASSHIITGLSKNGFMAQYEPGSDSYGVFVDEVGDMPEEAAIFKDQLFESVSLNPDLILLGVAIHEVRHRLQYKGRIEIFTEGSCSEDPFMNEHIIYNKISCSYKNFIKGHEKIEFDAYLVQRHFLSLAASKSTLSLDTIFDCLFLEAD
jgi:hypothetical protein